MRFSALIPIIFVLIALILSFLCLFAGNRSTFMEDYDLLTVNTSRIGRNLIDSKTQPGSNRFTNFIHNITSEINDNLNEAVGSFAEKVGVEDFYSAHILNYCEGQYEPQPVPNDTVSARDIYKNVTYCSAAAAMYNFDPAQVLQESLNKANVSITVRDLRWPQDIEDALNALRIGAKAVFVLYCIGIGLAFIALFTGILALFMSGRLIAFTNVFITFITFLALLISTAIVTTFIVRATDAINNYGNEIGVAAYRGNKYLAITWAATASIFVAMLAWSLECCIGHRKRRHIGSRSKI